MNNHSYFKDVFMPRKEQVFGFLSFATRTLNLKKTMEINKDCTPQDVKDIVANSAFLNTIIEAESVKSGICKDDLKKDIIKYLDEMALGRNLYSIRTVIYLLLKISSILKVGAFVNESQILELRECMGKKPCLFLPTHRSYVDCIIVGFLCYQFDIEVPVTAAGIDIGRMAVIGKLFRESATFYMRRTLAGASLYEATLRQYVQTLVTSYHAPFQFFIEGTRSRSNKSITPKYGMLSMTLTPVFTKEVSDMLLIPVHISYDRLAEQLPLVYEHLGVPKPRESTMSLIKAVLGSNDNLGNIYIHIGTPFSADDSLNEESKNNQTRLTNISTTLKYQQITGEQFVQVQKMGEYIISLQQKYTVTNVANLIAAVLMGSLIKNKPLTIDEAIGEVKWMMDVVKRLGGFVLLDNVVTEVERILVVHKHMMIIDSDRKLKLIASSIKTMFDEVKGKMKGHTLKDETIVDALPVMQLQLYVNPILHYFVPASLVLGLLSTGVHTQEKLATYWHRLRKLLKYEFFYHEKDEDTTFSFALEYCIQKKVMAEIDGSYSLGSDERLQFLLKWTIWPALTTLLKCAEVMTELKNCEHKKALKAIQEQVELSECHPYCLSLDVAANCLRGLVLDGALLSHKGDDVVYELVPAVMNESRQLIKAVLPKFNVQFGRNNAVILHQEDLV